MCTSYATKACLPRRYGGNSVCRFTKLTNLTKPKKALRRVQSGIEKVRQSKEINHTNHGSKRRAEWPNRAWNVHIGGVTVQMYESEENTEHKKIVPPQEADKRTCSMEVCDWHPRQGQRVERKTMKLIIRVKIPLGVVTRTGYNRLIYFRN